MTGKVFFGILVTAFITDVHCGRWCTIPLDYIDKPRDTNAIWCEYGCCGEFGETLCCRPGDETILLVIFGCTPLIAIIVSVIVCVCCRWRTMARRGHVVGTSTAVITPTALLGGPLYSVTSQMAYPQTSFAAVYSQPCTGQYPAHPPALPPIGDQLNAHQVDQPPPFDYVQPT